MMSNKNLLLISVLLLAACTYQQNKDETDADSIGDSLQEQVQNSVPVQKNFVNTQIHYDGISEDDPFIKFYERFNADSAFQISHVKYPLQYVATDMDREMDTTLVTADNKGYDNLSKQQGELDKFDLHISYKEGMYVVKQRGIENGILVLYYFKEVNDEWKLIKIEDFST